MPSGAKRITTWMMTVMPADKSCLTVRVPALAWRMAMPKPTAQARMPM